MKVFELDRFSKIALSMKQRRLRNPDEDHLHFDGREVENTSHVVWGALEVAHETKLPVFYAYARAGDERLYALLGVETSRGILLLDPEWGRAFERRKCPYTGYMRANEDGTWGRF